MHGGGGVDADQPGLARADVGEAVRDVGRPNGVRSPVSGTLKYALTDIFR